MIQTSLGDIDIYRCLLTCYTSDTLHIILQLHSKHILQILKTSKIISLCCIVRQASKTWTIL